MITEAQIEAIATADAYLNNANLPTYKELAYQLHLLIAAVDSFTRAPYHSNDAQSIALSDCANACEVMVKATKTV